MKNRQESNIVKGFLAGKENVIRLFYERNFQKIKVFIEKNSGTETDAEDVFQEAIIITYQKLRAGSLQLECSLGTYVFAVSRNIWMNTLRKRNKIRSWDKLPEISDTMQTTILEDIHTLERLALYQKYFLKLGENCQRLLGFFFSGKRMSEIADSMGYSGGYARKKKFECKKRLIEMVEQDPLYEELRYESFKEGER